MNHISYSFRNIPSASPYNSILHVRVNKYMDVDQNKGIWDSSTYIYIYTHQTLLYQNCIRTMVGCVPPYPGYIKCVKFYHT